MEKEKYVKPTCRAIHTDPEPTPPNEIPDYDDWLE